MPYTGDPSERRRQLRTERHAKGLCIICERTTIHNKLMCEDCLVKERNKISNRAENRLCKRCGKRPPALHKKQCVDCLAIDRVRARQVSDIRAKQFVAWRQRLKIEVLTYYAKGTPSCLCCGESNIGCLVLDHVNTDGADHRRKVGSSYIYSWIKQHKFPEGFQVMCYTCNQARHWNNGLCPAHEEHTRIKQIRQSPHQYIPATFMDLFKLKMAHHESYEFKPGISKELYEDDILFKESIEQRGDHAHQR